MPLSLIEKYIGNEEPKHGENHPEIVFEHGINHLLTSRQEIIGLLKKIYRNHSLLTVSFDDKEQRFGSAILEINTENNYLVIDEFWPEIGNSETLLKKKLDISTYHAGINMHFNNAIEEIAEKDDAPYYKIRMPMQIAYKQRRSSYRVKTGISNPIPVSLATEDQVLIRAELRDISIGGMNMRLMDDPVKPLRVEDQIPTCIIRSRYGQNILASIEICRIKESNFHRNMCIATRFTGIGKPDRRALEQLIATLDRETIKKTNQYSMKPLM